MVRKTKTTFDFYAHLWEYDELSYSELKKFIKPEDFSIRLYGLTECNESVCVHIENFKPYVYVELPEKDLKGKIIKWTEGAQLAVKDYITHKLQPYDYNTDERCVQNLDYQSCEITRRKTMRCYTREKEYKKLIRINMHNIEHIKKIKYKLYNSGKERVNKHYIPFLNTEIAFELYEDWVDPLVKYMANNNNMCPVGWKRLNNAKLVVDNKKTTCKFEFICDWKQVQDIECDKTVQPLFLSFDIETYSSRWNSSGTGSTSDPDESVEKDEVYMVSCVFHRYMSNKYEKYLITDRPCAKVDKDVTLIQAKNESDLLLKFKELLLTKDPDVLLGHNILGYDLRYMAYRSGCPKDGVVFDWVVQKRKNTWPDFSVLGRMVDKKCRMITNKWASGAYKGMNFDYIKIDGRLLLDTNPYVRRTQPGIENCKLDYISELFLKEKKHDVSYTEQYRIYDTGDPKLMAKVARYCVQDTILPIKLLYKLNIWIDLLQISTVVGVPIFEIYTRGQQRRAISQVYRKVYKTYVMDFGEPEELSEEEAKEKFQGAFVVTPVPGLYENVICMDFSSLYPSMIRAYNLDYTTYVPEDDTSVSDDDCNIIEWDEEKKGEVIHYRFRFIKSSIYRGILPRILDEFTAARSVAKKEMEKHQVPDSDGQPLPGHEIEFASSNSKQKELKVSSNSFYGILGFRRGRMGLMPAAMSTTAKGRQSIMKVIEYIKEKYEVAGAELVYGDTDSAMFRFKNWDFTTSFTNGLKLADEVSQLFPQPMKLNFEKIFKVFLILSKKRYAGYIYNSDGKFVQLMKKGLMLARRNYCKYAKEIYFPVLTEVLDTANEKRLQTRQQKIDLYNRIVYIIQQHIRELMSGNVPIDKLMIRNSWNPTITKVVEIDGIPREIKTYKGTGQQAHDVLVHRMMSQGYDIHEGDIIYYVFTENDGKTRQSELVEDPIIFKERSDTKINYIYYLTHQVELTLKPLLETIFNGYNFCPNVSGKPISSLASEIVSKIINTNWVYSVCVGELKELFKRYPICP